MAFGGTVTSPGGVLTQTANTNGLSLTAKFTSVGSAIKVDATLKDTTGADRGIEVAFRLPLDIAGWTWNNDFITPVPIASGIRYERPHTSFATQTLGHTHSVYPFATVHNSTAAFSLAVPMGPLMDRLSYDDSQGFRVTYDVGLSTATTSSPSTAKFSFWIYTNNPKWGMRSAAEKYYALNPGSFTTNATVQGAWALKNTLPLSSVPDHEDFGWGYEETDSELAFDNANGIVGLHYMSFPQWDINIPGYASQPPYSVLIGALTAALSDGGNGVDGIPKDEMAAAVVATAPYDTSDLHQLSWNSYYWYGNRLQMYPVLAYSTLPGSTYGLRKQYSVDNQIEEAEGYGNVLGGIFLDNTTYVFGNIENYRKSLWAYNKGPLSFSYRTGETIQYVGDSMFDFTGALRTHLNDQDKILMASITPGSYVWFSHNVDVVGGEVGGAEVLDRIYPRRTMSYGKDLEQPLRPRPDRPDPGPGPRLFPAGSPARLLPGLQRRLLGQLANLRTRPRPLQALHADHQEDHPGRLETRQLHNVLFGLDTDRTLRQPLRRHLLRHRPELGHLDHRRHADPRWRRPGHPGCHRGHRQGAAQQHQPRRHSLRHRHQDLRNPRSRRDHRVRDHPGRWRQAPRVPSSPIARATLSPGQTVQFTDLSTNSPTSWAWTFGDGGTSTAKNPTHVFSANGSYRVNLTVSNASGSSSGAHTVVVGGGVPAAQFTYSPGNPSPGQSVHFTDLSTNSPTSWYWTFGDGGTSTYRNPNHIFAANGSYRVNLTATNASGSSSGAHTVVVGVAMPAAQFTHSPGNPSPGQSVQFTDLSTNSPTSWYWTFGDGGASTNKNPFHVFSAPGSYRVNLTVNNAGGSHSGAHTVIVR